MRLQIASDLHLELLETRFPGYTPIVDASADLLLLAGDIHSGHRVLESFGAWRVPVLAIRGNHEFYGHSLEDVIEYSRRTTADGRVRIVEQEATIVGGARILACTLWTDYELYGDAVAAMDAAERRMLDHRRITCRAGTPFLPCHALAMHRRAAHWLEEELNKDFPGPTVVCTHHAPCPASIAERYRDDPCNPAFISDLSHLFSRVDLWVHGHVHTSFDYVVGRTRVIANPRGYALNLKTANLPAALRWENPHFDPGLVISI